MGNVKKNFMILNVSKYSFVESVITYYVTLIKVYVRPLIKLKNM